MVNHRHEHAQHYTADFINCFCPQCRQVLAEGNSFEDEGGQNESYAFDNFVVDYGFRSNHHHRMSLLSPSAPLLEVENPAYNDTVTPPPSYGSMLACFMSDEPPRYQVVTGTHLNHDNAILFQATMLEARLIRRRTVHIPFKMLVILLVILVVTFVILLVTLIVGCGPWKC